MKSIWSQWSNQKYDKLVGKHTRQMESFASLKRIFLKKMFEIWPESGREKKGGGGGGGL